MITHDQLRKFWPTSYLAVVSGRITFEHAVDCIQPRLNDRTTARHAPSPPEFGLSDASPELPAVDSRWASHVLTLLNRALKDVPSAEVSHHWIRVIKLVSAFLDRVSKMPEATGAEIQRMIEEALAPAPEPQRSVAAIAEEIGNLERIVRSGRSNPRLVGRLERLRLELANRSA